ncbi:MAG: flagellar assembly protein FliW, partial [Deferribacterales bacterium]|nr:flagellar assembly protein FliW [Deferribacterales bacterium]
LGIRVMAICPGWIKTEFFDRAVHDDTISYYNRFYEADEVVKLAISDMKEVKIFCIVVVPEDPKKSTANLRAPLVINFEKKLAKQIILDDDTWKIKTPLFQ